MGSDPRFYTENEDADDNPESGDTPASIVFMQMMQQAAVDREGRYDGPAPDIQDEEQVAYEQELQQQHNEAIEMQRLRRAQRRRTRRRRKYGGGAGWNFTYLAGCTDLWWPHRYHLELGNQSPGIGYILTQQFEPSHYHPDSPTRSSRRPANTELAAENRHRCWTSWARGRPRCSLPGWVNRSRDQF